jgi:hypothetical protein
VPRQFCGVPLQLGQIVERIAAAQLTRVDETHEQVAHMCAIAGLIEQSILAMQNPR